jgi:hypothetical protein
MALTIRLLAGIFLGAIPLAGILICMIMILYRVRKTFSASLPNRLHERPDEKIKQTAIQSILSNLMLRKVTPHEYLSSYGIFCH